MATKKQTGQWTWSCGFRMGHGKDLEYCLAKGRKLYDTPEEAKKALKAHFRKSPWCCRDHFTGWGRRYRNYGSLYQVKRGKVVGIVNLDPDWKYNKKEYTKKANRDDRRVR